jgi:thiamine transport system substrate-binding protein
LARFIKYFTGTRRLAACWAFCGLAVTGFAKNPVVTVYTYDAFTAEGALGPILAKAFEKKFVIETKYVGFPSVGEALNQIVLEGSHTHADLVVGIDNTLVARANDLKAFLPLDATLIARVPENLRFDSESDLIPFDYGYVSIVYDSSRGTSIPEGMSLTQFAKSPTFRNRLIIEDPRTSSLGLAFLAWTYETSGAEKFGALWDALSQTILTTAPSWSSAYALFLRREADFVVSYTTSLAYHRVKEKKGSFRAAIFPEGNFRQVEGAGVIKSSSNQLSARRWISFLLSPSMQAEIPTSQWMYPVVEGTKLPPCIQELPQIKKAIQLTPNLLQTRTWIREWTHRMARLK